MWESPVRLPSFPYPIVSDVRLMAMNRYIKAARERGDYDALAGLINRVPCTIAVEMDDNFRIVSLKRNTI